MFSFISLALVASVREQAHDNSILPGHVQLEDGSDTTHDPSDLSPNTSFISGHNNSSISMSVGADGHVKVEDRDAEIAELKDRLFEWHNQLPVGASQTKAELLPGQNRDDTDAESPRSPKTLPRAAAELADYLLQELGEPLVKDTVEHLNKVFGTTRDHGDVLHGESGQSLAQSIDQAHQETQSATTTEHLFKSGVDIFYSRAVHDAEQGDAAGAKTAFADLRSNVQAFVVRRDVGDGYTTKYRMLERTLGTNPHHPCLTRKDGEILKQMFSDTGDPNTKVDITAGAELRDFPDDASWGLSDLVQQVMTIANPPKPPFFVVGLNAGGVPVSYAETQDNAKALRKYEGFVPDSRRIAVVEIYQEGKFWRKNNNHDGTMNHAQKYEIFAGQASALQIPDDSQVESPFWNEKKDTVFGAGGVAKNTGINRYP